MKSKKFLIGELSDDYLSGRYVLNDVVDERVEKIITGRYDDTPVGLFNESENIIDRNDIFEAGQQIDSSYNQTSMILTGEDSYLQRIDGSDYRNPLTFSGENRPVSISPARSGRFSWRTPDSSYQSNHVAVTQKNSCFPIANGNWTFEFWQRCNYFYNDNVRYFDTGNNSDAGAIVFGVGSTGAIGWGRPTAGTGCGTAAGVIKMGQWHHIVFTSEGGGLNGRIFVDGVLQAGPVGYTNMTANDRSMRIGNQNVAANWSVPDMQFSDFRFFSDNVYPRGSNVATIGTKYFTPDTKPAVTDLVTWDGGQTYRRTDSCELHTFADAYLVDRSKNSLVVAQSGTSPYITSESPYTEDYAANVSSYSWYFDGDYDYMAIPHNSGYNLDSDEWTVECWFNTPSTTTALYNKRIFEKYVYASSTDRGWLFSINRTGGPTIIFNWFANTAISFTSNEPVSINTWHHMATSKKGDRIAFWYDGKLIGSATGVDGYAETYATPVSLGASSPASQGDTEFDGHIADCRIVKGTAVYDPTQEFIQVPTEPLTAIPGTTLLVCGTNRFEDLSTNNASITVTGTPKARPFNPYDSYKANGAWSTRHDGTNDYFTAASSNAFILGTNDFTMEWWCRDNYIQDYTRKIFANYNTWAAGSLFVGKNAGTGVDGRMSVWINNYSTGASLLTDPNFMTDEWIHYAIVRSGSSWTLYRNGTSVATNTWSGSVNTAATFVNIGGSAEASGAYSWYGHISNFRLVNGTALYSGTFTPEQQLSAVPNTVLLTCQDSRIWDNSPYRHVLTHVGNVRSTPWSHVTERAEDSYPMDKVEKDTTGSIYFDGNEYVQAPENVLYSRWDTDFTIECWIHPTSIPSPMHIWTNTTANSDGMTGGYVYTDGKIGMGRIGVNETASAAGVIVLNRWHHVAFVRNGTALAIFVNGVQVATPTTTNLEASTVKPMTIGGQFQSSGNSNWNGYIADFRVIKGRGIYKGNFTPPSKPLENIEDTSLLACNTKYGWTNFHPVDEVGGRPSYVLRQTGDPKLSSFSPLAPGGWSNYFDGSGDYLTVPDSTAFDLDGDYTLECWFFPQVSGGLQRLIMIGDYRSGYNGIDLYVNGSNQLVFYSNGASIITAGAVNNFQWNHVALVRSGNSTNNTTLYLNGTSIGQATSTTSFTGVAGNGVSVGLEYSGASTSVTSAMYISNVRIVKGTAVYTEAFTPPTSPLTAVSGTQLLTCQDSAFLDNSPNRFQITKFGEARTVQFSPFNSTTVPNSYSMYFDGTGDQLTTTATSDFNFSTGDWTVEGWFYRTAYGNTSSFLSVGTGGSALYSHFKVGDSNGALFAGFGSGSWAWTSQNTSNNNVIQLNTWHHVAFVKSDTSLLMFVDGVNVHTSTPNFGSGAAGTVNLGSYFNNYNSDGSWHAGHVSNFRIVKGTALYTANFTPSTEPLTAISGTSLLTCQSSYNIDNSDNALTLTGSGNVTASKFNPFGYSIDTSQEYDAEVHGGSTYLDGNDYWALMQTERNLTMYTGNWTIEQWVYPTTTSSGYRNSFYIYGNTIDGLSLNHDASTGLVRCGFRSTNQSSLDIDVNTGVCKYGAWTHIAFERNGTTLTVYVNGVPSATGTIASTATLNEFQDNWFHQPRIGAASNTDKNFVIGNVGPLRITKEALYRGVGFVPDINTIQKTKNLVSLVKWHTSGIPGETGRNMLQLSGEARTLPISPVEVDPGVGVFLDGSGDYVRGEFTPNLGDFTIECWVYLTGTGGMLAGSANGDYMYFGTGGFGFGWYVSTNYPSFNGTFLQRKWYHIEVNRSSGTIYCFVDGVSYPISSGSHTSLTFLRSTLQIGTYYTASGNWFPGYISNYRIKNVATHTSNFTPPTAPLEPDANTIFLSLNGKLTDSSTNGHTVNVYGNTSMLPLSPFGLQTKLQVNKNSYYFDGTGDYITVTNNSESFAFGTGDFTIEFWYLSNNAGVQHFLYDGRTANGVYVSLYKTTGNKIELYVSSAARLTGLTSLLPGVWYHVALVRSNGETRIYLNGTQDHASPYTDTNNYLNGVDRPIIGAAGFTLGGSPMSGYLDNIRVTKGVARYTSDFIPSARIPGTSKFETERFPIIEAEEPIASEYEYQGNTATFTATGSNQTWTVPNDVYLITAKLWGAGGGNRSTAGAGGYTEAEISVTPGEQLTLIVGVDGSDGGGVTSDSYGGGGGAYSDGGNGGRQGGGRSAIIGTYNENSYEILTAGGGGGSGYNHGGYGGGGLIGQSAGDGVGGGGGTQTAGGAGGSGSGGTAEAGVAGTGGISTSGYAGGGGGGGFFGGGGSSGTGGNHRGGGGGSGFVGRDGEDTLSGTEWGTITSYGEYAHTRPSPAPFGDLTKFGFRKDTVTGRYYNLSKCLRGASGSSTATNNTDPQYPGSVGGASQPGYIVINY